MRKPLLVFLPLLALLAGCPKRIDFGPGGELQDARRLLELTSAAEAQISSVKGEARLQVESPQARGGLTTLVAASRPGLLRLELLGFFGQPQAQLVSDGTRFGLYRMQEGTYYRGPATPRNLARLLPVALPPVELVGLLLGQAPRIPADAIRLEVDPGLGAYLVTLGRGGATQRLWIHPKTHRVIRSEVRGGDAYDLEFADFQEAGAVVFPRKLVFSAPAARIRLELQYTDVTLNEPPDPAIFTPEAPEGARIIEVDEAGEPRPGA